MPIENRSCYKHNSSERRSSILSDAQQKSITLVLGGVRSGKSRYAEMLAARARRVIFVATAQASDEEMAAKISRHRESRPSDWVTIEEPLSLGETVSKCGSQCDLILVDCLTVFASNTLHFYEGDDARTEREIATLCTALRSSTASVVLVSNEVGSGIVPAYALGRRYRDLLGEINQRVAALSDNAVLMVAGLPITLKGHVEVSA